MVKSLLKCHNNRTFCIITERRKIQYSLLLSFYLIHEVKQQLVIIFAVQLTPWGLTLWLSGN